MATSDINTVGNASFIMKSDDSHVEDSSAEIVCKLTSPELRKRKETVIADLKKLIIQKEELENGYAYKFPGTDQILDTLMEFVKAERACCNFFTYHLAISGDKKEVWLQLTGSDKAKDFIVSELEL